MRYSCWYYASQIWATPYLQQGKEMDSPLQTVFRMSVGSVEKDVGGQTLVSRRHHAFMVCHL